MQFKPLVESYFQASNNHDVATTLDHFAADAVVHDEGKEHQGHDQIRRWLEETNASYNALTTVLDISGSGDEATAVFSVSGTFPGSPIQLKSSFVLADDKIKSLTFGE